MTVHTPQTLVDDLYLRSTQFRLWLFTLAALHELRLQTNAAGAAATAARVAKVEADARAGVVVVPAEKLDFCLATPLATPLTADEEAKLLQYYARMILQVADLFKMLSQVRGTAIAFFRRFYLVHSVMEFHPKHIMRTCVFLAAKLENYFILVRRFSEAVKAKPEELLQYEFDITTALQFLLACHHPFKPMHGFFLDIQAYVDDVDLTRLGVCYDAARKGVVDSLFSDAQFLFSPPHITLTCMWNADQEMVLRYLKRRFKDESEALPEASSEALPEAPLEAPPETEPAGANEPGTAAEHVAPVTLNDMKHVIRQCAAVMATATAPLREEVTPIDRKLHYCLHPEKMLESRAKQ